MKLILLQCTQFDSVTSCPFGILLNRSSRFPVLDGEASESLQNQGTVECIHIVSVHATENSTSQLHKARPLPGLSVCVVVKSFGSV